MPLRSSQLPPGIGDVLAGTQATDADRIIVLKDELQTTQSALEKESAKSASLESENAILRDNTKIKKDAVWYAKFFMCLIPLVYLLLLLASVSKGVSYNYGQDNFSFEWSIVIGGYAQAAFVVGPIVFVATVLGFLLKGVFRHQQQKVRQDWLNSASR